MVFKEGFDHVDEIVVSEIDIKYNVNNYGLKQLFCLQEI